MEKAKDLSLLSRPICQNLRTKALYVAGGSLQNLVETNPYAQYWCNCTMAAVGPDDKFVSPEGCARARTCFEPIGGEVVA